MKIFVKMEGHWFDVSSFDHPGGSLKKYHLKDTTDVFNQIRDHSDGYVLGELEELEIKDKSLIEELEKKQRAQNIIQ